MWRPVSSVIGMYVVRPCRRRLIPPWRRPSRAEPLADAELVQQLPPCCARAARAHPLLDVFAGPVLEHHALDPLALEQQRQRQPRRTGTDDADLGSHGVTRASIGTGMVQRYLPHTRRESGGDRTQREERDVSIDGSWEITVQTPMGPQSSKLELKSDGGALTGTQSGGGEQTDIYDGSVDG